MKSSRPLNKLFEEAHDNLAMLVTKTRLLKRLTVEFRSHIDPELAPHCYISNHDGLTLYVYVDSAAWATRLRFQIPQLLPVLRQSNPIFAKLESIRVSILTQGSDPKAQPPASPGPVMSAENADVIKSLSDNIDAPLLQQALRRLARHARRK